MALSLTKAFYGPVTIDFRDSVAPASRFSKSGIKADVMTVTIEKKTDVIELEDGQEIKNANGWTGTLELKISELDDTDLTALETYAPGATNGIDQVKITFTDRGSGTNYTVTIDNITSIETGIETGTTWKTVIKLGITGSASEVLTDFVTVAHA